jgi:hypothetical protein
MRVEYHMSEMHLIAKLMRTSPQTDHGRKRDRKNNAKMARPIDRPTNVLEQRQPDIHFSLGKAIRISGSTGYFRPSTLTAEGLEYGKFRAKSRNHGFGFNQKRCDFRSQEHLLTARVATCQTKLKKKRCSMKLCLRTICHDRCNARTSIPRGVTTVRSHHQVRRFSQIRTAGSYTSCVTGHYVYRTMPANHTRRGTFTHLSQR